MDELIKAIVTKYKSDAGTTLRAKTGADLWLDVAPQTASGMWLVVSAASNGIDWVMASTPANYTEDITVSFRLCSDDSMADVMAALPLLTALYDNTMLTITGHTCILAQRTREWFSGDYDSEGYLAYVDYHYIVGT